jgi:hypothetical protein
LNRLVRFLVAAFELDADRKIVTAFAPFVTGFARMPCAKVERHVLHELPVAPKQKVRGNLQSGDLREIRVLARRQSVREQPIDPWAAILPRRQADPMHDDELGRDAAGALIAIGRVHEPSAVHEPGLHIDIHGRERHLEHDASARDG